MKWLIGNWKASQKRNDVMDFIRNIPDEKFPLHLGISPSISHLHLMSALPRNKNIYLGLQDISCHPSGAFTGENPLEQLMEYGASFCLVGHSERRAFGETREERRQKIAHLIEKKMRILYCIGETKEQRQQGQTENTLKNHIDEIASFKGPFLIAYEPVWAIGTGVAMGRDDILKSHAFISSYLKKKNISANILYGGSVKPSNVKDIVSTDNVDGVLVGGASLKSNSFFEIASTLKDLQ